MIPMARPIVDEEDVAAVAQVLRSGGWAAGPEVRAFENEFATAIGVRHAVVVANGTVAIHAALLAGGVGPGDRVITTPFTFIATANAILHCGAEPIFVDVDPETFLIDLDRVEAALASGGVRAILPVHLFGQTCDLDRLEAISLRSGAALIEDCAQAHGATWNGRVAGSVGAAGTFSFYATKNLPMGEGGMVTTNSDDLAAKLRRLVNHGRAGIYEHVEVGYNYRTTDVLAALGRRQLGHLSARNARRRQIAGRYRQGIVNAHLRHPTVRPDAGHVYHQYTFCCADRDALQAHLRERGVASAVFYPIPVHRQSAYAALSSARVSLPNAERAAVEVLSIPVHPGLADAEVDQVIEACNSFRT